MRRLLAWLRGRDANQNPTHYVGALIVNEHGQISGVSHLGVDLITPPAGVADLTEMSDILTEKYRAQGDLRHGHTLIPVSWQEFHR